MPNNTIRTPDERFQNLSDFPFAPNYLDSQGMRIHYVSEGVGEETVLCLHGEPSWSYLYRKMIPTFAKKYRTVAFDFIGFGRSDKYADKKAYSYELHYKTLQNVVEQLDLQQITIVVQDWGGLIGLPYSMANPDRISRLVIMNTMLPSARATSRLKTIPRALPFFIWQFFTKIHPNLPISGILNMATTTKLSKEVKAAYDAPFHNKAAKAGAAIWPSLVPIFADNPAAQRMQEARAQLKQWNKPALVLFSDKDPIMRGKDKYFRHVIPTAKAQPYELIRNAGHFLQEDKGEEIAEKIVDFMGKT